MRVLLYEWCCSGGLAGGDASIAREGRLMLEALAADAAKDSKTEIAVLVDAAMSLDLPKRARRIPVQAGRDTETLVAAAREADWTIIVAPESDGILLDRTRRVRAAGGRVLGPQDRVIDIGSDKQITINTLAARGVPVPAGRTLLPRTSIPVGFHIPAVRKASGGCGCEDLRVMTSPDVPPSTVTTRLEAFVAGTPVGISVICGPFGPVALPPMRQRFCEGVAPRYQGSELLKTSELVRRATALGLRATQAVEADMGWLGIDMILGTRADGRDDRVLEVNPRVTTSIVGLAPLFASSLVAAMIDTAEGRAPEFRKPLRAVPRAGSFSIVGDGMPLGTP